MIARFPSLTAFLDHAIVAGACTRPAQGDHWDLGVSGSQALNFARTGNPSMTATMLDTAREFATAATAQLEWTADMAGSCVCVPTYLSGSPMCMRRRKPVDTGRHVSIYASACGGGRISADTMLRRGMAVLGLLEALQASRVSVDLYLMIDTGGQLGGTLRNTRHVTSDVTDGSCTMIIPIETRPLDLATAGFALAHPAFYRNLGYEVARTWGYTGSFSPMYRDSGARAGNPVAIERYTTQLRSLLDLAPSDIVIPRVGDTDAALTDPQAWISARVSQVLA